MSDDTSDNPKWLAVSPTIKDRYLRNLSRYQWLNDNERDMMSDLHELIDAVAAIHAMSQEG